MPGIRGAGLLLLIGALLAGLFAEDNIGEFSNMEAAGLMALGSSIHAAEGFGAPQFRMIP